MSKHTPRPWQAKHIQPDGTQLVPPGYGWGVVAVEPMRGRIDSSISGMKEDDARLIAAAPELLEALKLVWEMFDDGRIVRNIANDGKPDWALKMLEFTQELSKIQAALAKAEGRA